MWSLKLNFHFALRLVIFNVVIFGSFGIALSQDNPCPTFNSYIQLDAARSRLQKKATELDSQIKDLKENITELEQLQTELANINKRIEENEGKPDDALNNYKSSLEGKIAIVSEGKTVGKLNEDLTQKEAENKDTQTQLECVDNTLRSWLSPEGYFKWSVNVIFAVLIGLVIFGFFFTTLRDEKVRQAVFGGQVGLQFIALFSIVIAIILFGITGILEAKELSALLGSIAGYILGRTVANQRSSDSDDNNGGTPGGDFASKIASVRINPASVNLDANKPSEKLTATLLDAAGNASTPPTGAPSLQWKSSDEKVAAVDSTGLVTRVKAGNAVITAEFNGKTANCAVTCN